MLDPSEDILIDIKFSEPVDTSAMNGNIVSYLKDNKIAGFSTSYSETTASIWPGVASFNDEKNQLSLVFKHEDLEMGGYYYLQLDASKLKAKKDSKSFLYEGAPDHIYSILDCACNGRGTCHSAWECVCEAPWAGWDCSACQEGYHGVGTTCKENIKCLDESCNGHGKCDDHEGFPQCSCDDGYSTSNDKFCSACSPGYTGFPNCTNVGQEVERNTLCEAPLLPKSLDTVSYLGYNGHTHIQGNYYIDVENVQHEMTFTLKEDSIFRLYSEPHWVDIDLWLYELDSAGEPKKIVDLAISFNEEEIIFTELAGAGTKYMIKIRYYLWAGGRESHCETFNMELEIAPKSMVIAEDKIIAKSCKPQSVFPSNESLTISTQFSSKDTQVYSINREDASISGATYFWKFPFEIAPAQKHTSAQLNVEIGYNFLAGQLGLILEEGDHDDHCVDDGDYCVFGDNGYNRNEVSKTLGPGKYTLWIYAPVPQFDISTCAIFDFRFDVNFVSDRLDFFNCDANVLPPSLNTPGYLDDKGYLHIQEKFSLAEATTAFEVKEQSFFRFHAESVDGSNDAFSFTVYDAVSKSSLPWTLTGENQFFSVLTAGKYEIRISGSIGDVFCPEMNMEIGIEPVRGSGNPTCPSSSSGKKLPNMAQSIQAPYHYEGDDFVSMPQSSNVIAQFTFRVDESSVVQAGVGSDFIRNDLRIELSDSTGQVVPGSHGFNYHRVASVIESGTWTVKIKKTTATSTHTALPACSPFTFDFDLVADTSRAECLTTGEPFPTGFATPRFLSFNGRMDYQAMVQAPADLVIQGVMPITRTIPLSVKTRSAFRAYAEPNVIDVDFKLINASNNYRYTSGSNGFNDEEVMEWILEADTEYAIVFTLWSWDDLPACPVFNFEMAVAPLEALTPQCGTKGDDNWPEEIPSDNLPSQKYYYDSRSLNNDLYFQQRAGEARTKELNFKLSSPGSFFAETGYDFLNGDIVLSVENKDTGDKYYGQNYVDRNVLKIDSLLTGNYVLKLYEPIVALTETIGCTHFTFTIFIDSRYDILANKPLHTFPNTLSGMAFLGVSGTTHIADVFSFKPGTTTSTFQVPEESLLRVDAEMIDLLMAALALNVNIIQLSGQLTATSKGGSLLAVIPAGSYTLTFTNPLQDADVMVVELAIAPMSQLRTDIAGFPDKADCTTTKPNAPLLNPTSGFFQDFKPNLRTTYNAWANNKNLVSLPLKLERDSLVFIEVGYDFLLGDLQLVIVSDSGTEYKGRNLRNRNQMYRVFGSGSYTIRIEQGSEPQGFIEDFAHCSLYSYKIIVKDAKDKNDHVDCSEFYAAPHDLSDPNSKFGGPVDAAGSVHIYGENFLISKSHPSTTVSFKVKEPSKYRISVWTKDTFPATQSYSLEGKQSTNLPTITSLSAGSSSYERVELYSISTGSGTDEQTIELRIQFDINSFGYFGTCPIFALQIDLKKEDDLKSLFACGPDINPTMPTSGVTADSAGFYSEQITSYFAESFIQSNTRDGVFSTKTRFEIRDSSEVAVDLQYNPLVNFFDISLETEDSWWGNWYRSSWEGQQEGTGSTFITSKMDIPYLDAGNYTFVITQKVIPALSNELCYPFIWNFQIRPYFADVGFVSAVSPPALLDVSPKDDMVLAISFSTDIYDSVGLAVNEGNWAVLIDTFSLQKDSDGTSYKPTSAEYNINRWELTWKSDSLASGQSYTLKMKPGSLFSENGKEVVYSAKNSYQILNVNCGKHGSLIGGGTVADVCVCDDGYAGLECEKCDNNYKQDNEGVCHPLQVCGEKTCGCLDPSAEKCSPAGECFINEVGSTQCKCSELFSGVACEQCATGYHGFPKCAKDKVCSYSSPALASSGEQPCEHGSTCDLTSGQCKCNGNWEGNSCETCREGCSGENCDICETTSFITTLLLIVSSLFAAGVLVGAIVWCYKKRNTSEIYNMLPVLNLGDNSQGDKDSEMGDFSQNGNNGLEKEDDDIMN